MNEIIIRKKAQIVLITVCAVFMLITIFLVSLSVMFSGGKNAADFFGSNLYLVKSDTFALIPAPCAVIGEKTEPSSLVVGNIIIFKNGEGVISIGEITEAATDSTADTSEPADSGDSETPKKAAGKSFKVKGESGVTHTVTEDAVVSKVVKTSRLLGSVIDFAVSPFGVLIIAVIPCMCIILSEVFKPVLRKITGADKVDPVKKQDETPTYIPIVSNVKTPPISKIPEPGDELQTGDDSLQEWPEWEVLPDNRDSEGIPLDADETAATAQAAVKPGAAAALKAYKDAINITQEEEEKPLLFVADEAPKSLRKTPEPPADVPAKKKPLSSVKLAEVIAQREREAAEKTKPAENKPLDVSEKAAIINQALSNLKKQQGGNHE